MYQHLCLTTKIPGSSWTKIFTVRQRRLINYFWSQKVPPISIWQEVHHTVWPQTTSTYFWWNSPSSTHGFSQTSEMGTYLRSLQLQYQLQTWKLSQQCWHVKQITLARESTRHPSSWGNHLITWPVTVITHHCCTNKEMDYPRSCPITSEELHIAGLVMICRWSDRTVLPLQRWAQHTRWMSPARQQSSSTTSR